MADKPQFGAAESGLGTCYLIDSTGRKILCSRQELILAKMLLQVLAELKEIKANV